MNTIIFHCWMIIIMKIIEGPMNGTYGHGFPQWFKATTETRPGSPQLLVSLCLPMEKKTSETAGSIFPRSKIFLKFLALPKIYLYYIYYILYILYIIYIIYYIYYMIYMIYMGYKIFSIPIRHLSDDMCCPHGASGEVEPPPRNETRWAPCRAAGLGAGGILEAKKLAFGRGW